MAATLASAACVLEYLSVSGRSSAWLERLLWEQRPGVRISPSRLIAGVDALACGLVGVACMAIARTAATPPFVAKIAPISAKQRALHDRRLVASRLPGPLSRAAVLTVSHWGFDGRRRTGRIVVNETARVRCGPCSGVSMRRGTTCGSWSPSTPTAGATSARSRPTTRRHSTAAAQPVRAAGRSTHTATPSTSTRSRTRT